MKAIIIGLGMCGEIEIDHNNHPEVVLIFTNHIGLQLVSSIHGETISRALHFQKVSDGEIPVYKLTKIV